MQQPIAEFKTRRGRTRLIAATVLALCLPAAGLSFWTAGGCSVIGEAVKTPPEPMPAAKCSNGKFERVNGVGVLTLWGTPYERGKAHGTLMARGVLDIVDAVCGSNLLLSDPADYEKKILPLLPLFNVEKEYGAELRGIFDGVQEKLGEGAVMERLGRPLAYDDLVALNTAGDWYRQGCSTFAAWGTNSSDGHVWVGRNFDFMPSQAFFPHQMIVVYKATADAPAWSTVSAPGLAGCITGLSDRGVFVSVHDVFLPVRPLESGFAPRLFVLRKLIETVDARDLEAQAMPILLSRRQMFDNSILLAAPVKDGTPAALVFEYDGDLEKTGGVTVRRPQDNEEGMSRELMVCTNHFRKRADQSKQLINYRYPLMRRVLTAKTGRGEPVNFEIARKAMGAVRLPITVHTVIADLNDLEYWYAPGDFLVPPGTGDYVRLPMKEWLSAR